MHYFLGKCIPPGGNALFLEISGRTLNSLAVIIRGTSLVSLNGQRFAVITQQNPTATANRVVFIFIFHFLEEVRRMAKQIIDI